MADLEKTATKIYIEYDTYTEVTSEANPDDSWSSDSTYSTHCVNNINLKNGYEYCYYPGEVKKGDTLYLLYAVWSTGDSFHRADGSQIDFISVHKSYENAERNEKILEQHTGSFDSDKGNYSTKIFLDNGEEYSYCLGWLGYFESLDHIVISKFIVQ